MRVALLPPLRRTLPPSELTWGLSMWGHDRPAQAGQRDRRQLQARPACARGGTGWRAAKPRSDLSRDLHVFEIARLVVDADARRRDPARELAGLDHLSHQALDEIAIGLRRQPFVLVL